MSRNSRNTNYSLRIAKAVERKMFCAAFQKLSVFHPLETYRYIGFGARYFADFYLVHRLLGIRNMISIEQSSAKSTKARYNFNKPFDCIDIKFKTSNEILPQLTWKQPSIVWLDYTCVLNKDVLVDLDTVLRNAVSGSFVIISVNSDSNNFGNASERLDNFTKTIGKNRLPNELEKNQINNKKLPLVYAEIIKKAIDKILLERNEISSDNTIEFLQLFNLKYEDGAPMYSYGGLILDTSQKELFQKVQFTQLPFIRTDIELFDIDVPNLTFKEIKFLEALLPNGINEEGVIISKELQTNPQIPPKDVLKFKKIYQYFPTFAETNLG